MQLLKIKNWKKFQHYKHRCPPWIKLHVHILNDRKFCALSHDSKCLLMLLWVLASENEGKIPNDIDEIRFRLRDNTINESDLKLLIKEKFLLTCKQALADDSTAQASAVPEAETETETETEAETESPRGDFFRNQEHPYFKSIETSCIKILKLRPKSKPFNPFQAVNQKIKAGIHPGALDQALIQLVKYWDESDIKSPYGYLTDILKTTNGNWHEKEHIENHEKLKQDFAEYFDNEKIKTLIKGVGNAN